MIPVGYGIVFSQFFPDQFQLFPEDIISLVFIDPLFYLFLDLCAKTHHLDLTGQDHAQCLVTVTQRYGFQDLLSLLEGQWNIHRDMIYQFRNIFDLQCLTHLFLIHFLVFFAVCPEQFSHAAKHRFFYRIRKIFLLLLDHVHFRFQIRQTVF